MNEGIPGASSAKIVFEKFSQRQPRSLSTLADQVGACVGVLTPIFDRIQAHVLPPSGSTAITRPNMCWLESHRARTTVTPEGIRSQAISTL